MKSKVNYGIYMVPSGLINHYQKHPSESVLHQFIQDALQIIELELIQFQEIILSTGITELLLLISNLNSVLFQLLIYQTESYKRTTYFLDTFSTANTKLSLDLKITDSENPIQTFKMLKHFGIQLLPTTLENLIKPPKPELK